MRTRQGRRVLVVAPAVTGGLALWSLGDRSRHPESLADWAGLSIWLLACTVLVCVVLVGTAQGLALMRNGRATDAERIDRRQRSAAVGQLIVGGAALLAFLTLGILAGTA